MTPDSHDREPPDEGAPPPEEEELDADLTEVPTRKHEDVAALIRTIEAGAQEKEKALEEGRARRRSRIWHVLLVLGILANGYLWIGQPTWLGLRGSVPTLADEEGVLRYRMYVEARRIEAFQRQHGALPESLEALGDTREGLRYRQTGENTWELMGEAGRARLVLHSTQALDDFMGVGSAPDAATTESGGSQP